MSTTPPPPPPPGQTPPPDPTFASPGGPARPHPKGTLVLVLGIVSLFICGIILGVVAFVMGNNAIKEIDANPGAYTNRGMVNAGRILGIVAVVLNVVVLIAVAASS